MADTSRSKAGILRTPEELRRYGGIEQTEERVMGKQPFDGRYEWMGDHPEDIEGHGLKIREAYLINEVPTEVVRLLHDCESSCQCADIRQH